MAATAFAFVCAMDMACVLALSVVVANGRGVRNRVASRIACVGTRGGGRGCGGGGGRGCLVGNRMCRGRHNRGGRRTRRSR